MDSFKITRISRLIFLSTFNAGSGPSGIAFAAQPRRQYNAAHLLGMMPKAMGFLSVQRPPCAMADPKHSYSIPEHSSHFRDTIRALLIVNRHFDDFEMQL
jgi:hypothetical protein